MRTIPFAILSGDYTSLVVSGAPTATVQYGSGVAASAAVTQRGSGWSVDVDETQDALVIVTLTGAAPCALTVLAARAAVIADKTGYALTPAYDHAKDDVLTPLAAVGGKADTLVARREAMDPAATQASATAALTAQGVTTARAAKLDLLPDTVVASKVDVDAATAAIDAKPVTPATDISGLATKTDVGVTPDLVLSGLSSLGYTEQLAASLVTLVNQQSIGDDWVSITESTLDTSGQPLGPCTKNGEPLEDVEILISLYETGTLINKTNSLILGKYSTSAPRGAVYNVTFRHPSIGTVTRVIELQ